MFEAGLTRDTEKWSQCAITSVKGKETIHTAARAGIFPVHVVTTTDLIFILAVISTKTSRIIP